MTARQVFLHWLATQTEPFCITPFGTIRTVENERCPLQVLTGRQSKYITTAIQSFGVPESLAFQIVTACDGERCSDVTLRADILAALKLEGT